MSDQKQTSICRGVARRAAIAVADAQKAYTLAFNAYYDTLDVLPDVRFWQLLKHYRKEVFDFIGLKRDNKDAAHEFLRKALVGDIPGFTILEAIQFAKTYSEKVSALYDPLFNTVTGRGDDGYGDLLDSLIILGEQMFLDCTTDSPFNGSNSCFEEAVKVACSECIRFDPLVIQGQIYRKVACSDRTKLVPSVVSFVLRGENYNIMHLREKCRMFFISEARKAAGETHPPSLTDTE